MQYLVFEVLYKNEIEYQLYRLGIYTLIIATILYLLTDAKFLLTFSIVPWALVMRKGTSI